MRFTASLIKLARIWPEQASERASERERERKRIRKREKKKELRETDIEVHRFRHTSPSIKVRQADHTKRE